MVAVGLVRRAGSGRRWLRCSFCSVFLLLSLLLPLRQLWWLHATVFDCGSGVVGGGGGQGGRSFGVNARGGTSFHIYIYFFFLQGVPSNRRVLKQLLAGIFSNIGFFLWFSSNYGPTFAKCCFWEFRLKGGFYVVIAVF